MKPLILAFALAVAPTIAVPNTGTPTEAEFSAVAVPLVAKWEGEVRCKDNPAMHCAYKDIVGVPTVCYGETKGVTMSMRFTDRQCKDMLASEILEYREGLHAYFTPETLSGRLTAARDAAYASLAYNVGVAGAGRSTATRRLNAGNIVGGCHALGYWNRGGGRVVRGLVNRRAEETALCLAGT